jgi:hypothetical protein
MMVIAPRMSPHAIIADDRLAGHDVLDATRAPAGSPPPAPRGPPPSVLHEAGHQVIRPGCAHGGKVTAGRGADRGQAAGGRYLRPLLPAGSRGRRGVRGVRPPAEPRRPAAQRRPARPVRQVQSRAGTGMLTLQAGPPLRPDHHRRADLPQLLQRRRPRPVPVRPLPPVPSADRPRRRRGRHLRNLRGNRHRLHLPPLRAARAPLRSRRLRLLRARRRGHRTAHRTRRHHRARAQAPRRRAHPGPPTVQHDPLDPGTARPPDFSGS